MQIRAEVVVCAALTWLVPFATAATTPAVSVRLNTHSQTIHVGDPPFTFTATVENAKDKTVVWKVNDITGGNSSTGTIDVNGKFTPPPVVPASKVVAVTAVSNADPTKSDTASVTLLNAVPSITSLDTTHINTKLAFKIVITGAHFQSNA